MEAIKSPNNSIFLSIISAREMQVKSQLGRLDLSAKVLELVMSQNKENGIEVLPISLTHLAALTQLPNYHGDPFDYLLISQALIEDMTIITNDPLITQYPVKTWWGKA